MAGSESNIQPGPVYFPGGGPPQPIGPQRPISAPPQPGGAYPIAPQPTVPPVPMAQPGGAVPGRPAAYPAAQPVASNARIAPADDAGPLPVQPRVAPGQPGAQPYAVAPSLAQPRVGAGQVPAASVARSAGAARPQAGAGQPARPRPVSAGASGQATAMAGAQEEEEDEDIYEKAVRNTPPWLISTALHMLLMIILGLIAAGAAAVVSSVELTVEAEETIDEEMIYAEQLGNQVEIDSPLAVEDDFTVQKPVLAEANLPPVENPFATPFSETEPSPDGTTAVSDIAANAIGLALDGRDAGVKRALLGRYGGNATTEEAVLRGLEWLARQQQRDGSWSLSGPFRDGVEKAFDNPQAATAMALLAFQGYGDTHVEGRFKANVSKGWQWLLKEQNADGCFFVEGPFNHRFYTQGQCTIAVCEILTMTKDQRFREAAERAVQYCLKSQSSEGGWRYSPNADSDLSVTGWIVMALQSARMAGIDVPADNLHQVERFLDRIAQADGSRYPYQKGGEPKLAMTAEAMLCRQYLGWRRNDPRMIDAMDWITRDDNLISFTKNRDVYYWYYATQAAHHMEGEWWKRWNTVMRQIMCAQQVKSGPESGSWDPYRPSEDAWTRHGGRLYVTCLSIYMLEVYYRHLPIYTKVYTDLLKSGRTPGT